MATTHADYGTKSGQAPAREGRSPVEVAKLVVSALVVVALLVFAIANLDEVAVDYVVGDAQVPLILVIGGSAVAGALVAALIRRRRS